MTARQPHAASFLHCKETEVRTRPILGLPAAQIPWMHGATDGEFGSLSPNRSGKADSISLAGWKRSCQKIEEKLNTRWDAVKDNASPSRQSGFRAGSLLYVGALAA